MTPDGRADSQCGTACPGVKTVRRIDGKRTTRFIRALPPGERLGSKPRQSRVGTGPEVPAARLNFLARNGRVDETVWPVPPPHAEHEPSAPGGRLRGVIAVMAAFGRAWPDGGDGTVKHRPTAPDRRVPAMIRAMPTAERLAQYLLDAYREDVRILACAETGPVDAGQAYAVQALVWDRLAGAERPRAWKVGAADKAAEPVAAPILPPRFSVSPGRFRRRGVCGVGVEAEIAVRFGRDLAPRRTPYSREEVLAAIGSVHVAMEVVDARLHDPAYAGPYWCLADNLVNGALVLGDAIPHWRHQDWHGLEVAIAADGRVVDQRPAHAPLDDLFHCLPWWIGHAGGARAGDVVTTGAWTGMHPVGNARELRVVFAGLGQCQALGGAGGDESP